MKHTRNKMRNSNFKKVALLLVSQMSCVLGFQQPRHNILSFAGRPQTRGFYFASTSELSAKFKLDNGMDDDDERSTYIPTSLRNISMDLSDELENVETFNSPSTTFGAEAVPSEQRPANEYLDLISAPFFDWANRPDGTKALGIRLMTLYVILYATVCWPISGGTFTVDGYLAHKILSSHIGALGFILIFCLRLYSGWGYIGSRLTSKEIEFEETGW